MTLRQALKASLRSLGIVPPEQPKPRKTAYTPAYSSRRARECKTARERLERGMA